MLHRRDCSYDISLLAHHDTTGTELSDVAACSQGMNRCWICKQCNSLASRSFGATTLQRIKQYLRRMRVTPSVDNRTVIPVVWGSYYRNVICIARSVGVGGNWDLLFGCNVARLCLDEYFSYLALAISTQELTTFVIRK